MILMPLNKNEPVSIVDYDDSWAAVFKELNLILQKNLGEYAISIEHIGSTSVPGLAAKPILDIDVVIESMDDFPAIVSILSKLGYIYEGDLGIKGREAFARESAEVPRNEQTKHWLDHHLYVCPKDSEQLAKHIAFRDFLRQSPKIVQQYADIKRELAERFSNKRTAYSNGKTEFIKKVFELIRENELQDKK